MPGDKRQDQRFLHTVQVRVRKRNPLIERSDAPDPTPHIDDDPTKALPDLAPAPAPEPRIAQVMDGDSSEVGSSIYERIEHTDRSEELAEAEAELEAALDGYAQQSHDDLPAAMPKAPPALEETRTYLGPEPETAPDRDAPVRDAPVRDAPDRNAPDRAVTVAPPSSERPAAPRPSQPRPTPAQERRAAPRASAERPAPRPAQERRAPPRARAPRPPAPSPDRATTALESAAPPSAAPPPVPPAPVVPPQRREPPPDRARTTIERSAPARKDPTTRGRAKPPRPRPERIDTEPTPLDEPAPRVAQLLDDDETVLASEPPRAGHHKDDQGAPGFRLVRRPPTAAAEPKEAAPTPVLEATPHERLAMLGTDAMGEVMKEHALQALGGSLPAVQHPALKLVHGHLQEGSLGVLEGMLAGRFDAQSDEPTVSIKRALERLVNDKHYGALHHEEQADLLRYFAAAPRDVTTVKAATALLKSGVTRHFGDRHRRALLSLFGALETEARVRVAQLAARKLRGRSALEDRDMQDQPLVVHLEALATAKSVSAPLQARGFGRNKLVNMVLGAIAHPERLSFEEGSDGVLGMLEFGLVDSAPAELARLWRHLAEEDMSVPLAGGAQLDLRARLQAEPSLRIGGSNTPLRLALRGLAELARPSARGRKPTFIMPGGHGIDADVMSRALELLYGFGFTVAAGSANAMRHLARVQEPAHRLPPVYVTVLYARGERVFLFDHADDDWIYLRAPRGRSTKQRGALRVDPRREVVDPERGLDRIPKEAFEEKVGVGLIPRL